MAVSNQSVLRVAVPGPFRSLFDYLGPETGNGATIIAAGTRVAVPFGHQPSVVAIVIEQAAQSYTPREKLRHINQILDTDVAIDTELMALCQWCADYYHYPLGETCHLALPALLRKPSPLPQSTEIRWLLTNTGRDMDVNSLTRAPKQRQTLEVFQMQSSLTRDQLRQYNLNRGMLKPLLQKGWISEQEVEQQPVTLPSTLLKQSPLALNSEQQLCLDSIQLDEFHCYLLEGVTGSGKTEVYLQIIAAVLKQKKQALVLVPEISLTPQTVARFEARFNLRVATLHSGLSDRERLNNWQAARTNQAKIIIGTRSSIFTPLPDLGVILVDEEHDLSYKQQEGVRYSARDLAIVRAQKRNIPLILGSATPSLESLHNALSGRFRHLCLYQRATRQPLPTLQCIENDSDQLGNSITTAINEALNGGQQVLIFINRRGYAPTLICQDCGWISQCQKCDSRMTLHSNGWLHCHYCEFRSPAPTQCPSCHSHRLQALGSGTQRSEEQLAQAFPNIPILRIDRDSVARKGQLQAALEQINSGRPCLMIGTQMLAKGHHFANLGLAVILGMDNGLLSSDFRGTERMGQLLTQVAGRVGRERYQGKVLIETRFADHPLLQSLLQRGYHDFAQHLLAERQLSGMPPWHYLALVRCHAQKPEAAQQFLQNVRYRLEQLQPANTGCQYLGPLPAVPEKRNNRYHFILQIKMTNRRQRQQLLAKLCLDLEAEKQPRGLHWLVDVDPQD